MAKAKKSKKEVKKYKVILPAGIVYRDASTTTKEELDVIQTRLDQVEASGAVMNHQLQILGGMLSPSNQEDKAREVEGLKHRCNSLRRDVDVLMKTHNGKHPPVEG